MKNRQTILYACLSAAFVMLALMCAAVPAEAAAAKLNKSAVTLNKGKKITLKVKNIKKGTKVKWSSSRKKVASVSYKGVVTAKAVGTTKIKAVVNKKTLICKCTVVPAKVAALNKSKITLTAGKKATLKVKNIKKGTKVKWSSSRRKVASVSSKGVVTAKTAGTATIKAVVNKKKLTCTVTVKKAHTNKGHFVDVPDTYWAYDAIERAYKDGVLTGTGGDASKGTGIFSPEQPMTYAEFVAMLIKAFYPEELARVDMVKEAEWYAPYIEIAFDRGILTNTLDEIMAYSPNPIYRYDAAWILVQLLEDKSLVLPSQQERNAAIAQIGDWDEVEKDRYWKYYVSCAWAMGVLTGTDDQGSFAGGALVPRAEGAAIYVRMADRIASGQKDSKAFQIVFEGAWDKITAPGYQEMIEKEFYTVYPRLWNRWGNAKIPKIIHVHAKKAEDMEYQGAAANTCFVYDTEQMRIYPYISISIDFANVDPEARILSHELTHVVQNYTSFTNTWWTENMAGYGRFRYCAWADEGSMDSFDLHFPQDESLLTWEYNENDNCHWFFAYMDEKYPTTKDGYGLIDSIHRAIRRGKITSDGGADQSDRAFNEIVQQITGFDNIEQLRQMYKQELENGTWTFHSFAGFPDNYITENLPNVPNPTYPVLQDFISAAP